MIVQEFHPANIVYVTSGMFNNTLPLSIKTYTLKWKVQGVMFMIILI